jgi:hypothetical protein
VACVPLELAKGEASSAPVSHHILKSQVYTCLYIVSTVRL